MDFKRNTLQRQLILEALKTLNQHATAEQVWEYIARTHPSVSKATVYRNLSQMAEAGDLLDIGSPRGATRYDHQTEGHYHFICDDCSRVFDVAQYMPELNDHAPGLDDFTIKNHRLVLYGLCPECGKK